MKVFQYFGTRKPNPKKVRGKSLSVLLAAAVLISSGLSGISAGTERVYAAEPETETISQAVEPRKGTLLSEGQSDTKTKTETPPSEGQSDTKAKTETLPPEGQSDTEPKTETLPSEGQSDTEPKTETLPPEGQSDTEPKTETMPSGGQSDTEPKTETLPQEGQSETESESETLPSETGTETPGQSDTVPQQSESVSESESDSVGDSLQNTMPQRPNLAPPIGQDSEGESESESGFEETFEEKTELSAAVREFLDAAAALPETITEENAEEVERLLTVCDAAYQKLTEKEKALPEVEEAFARVQRLLGLEIYKIEYGEQVTVDGITYEFDFDTDTKTAALDDILEPEQPTAVTVPGKVTYQGEEYTVTRITMSWGGSSRDDRYNVTGLTLPNTITEITGNFRQFKSLEAITIPGSVKAFKAQNAFMYMNKLKSITFEEGVEEISSVYMVDGCTSLTDIQLPSTLKLIDESAVFSGASALASIDLPDGLEFGADVGSMFQNCTSLQSITLPSSITKLHSRMFWGCTNLQSVRANGTITEVGSYAFCDPDHDAGCELLTEIPDLSQVTSMGTRAFYKCKGLNGASVDLSSLDEIPSYAFTYTSANITALSENLKSIGTWGLIWCNVAGNSDDGMTLTFPETLTSIDTYAFYAGGLPKTVVLPDTMTQVGANAFSAVDGIEEFWIGSGVTVINEAAFSADGLQKITVNNSKDALTTPENFPEGVEVEYLFASIGEVGDTISDKEGAPTLQEAVNDAESGETITIEKDVKLAKTLNIPTGKDITITSEDTFTILGGAKEKLENLIEVEAGASVTFGGSLVLSGRYNSKSIIASNGQVTLIGNAAVSNGRISGDYIGVIDISGQDAGFTLSGGRVENNAVTGQDCGTIRVSEGASVQIQGGVIRNNKIAGENNFNSSAGLLLSGSSSGTMSGGEISGNSSYRGSAIMLYSSSGEGHAAFELSGGTISGNYWTGEQIKNLGGAGAVYIEGDASFKMRGGNIAGNSGEVGGGVAVADSEIGGSPYNTQFVMTGGEISGNSAVRAGGGIYSYSNGVSLTGGSITGNSAGKMGGGIYSEGNTTAYSTLYMQNAYITGNSAEQGGGLWLCPTGDAKVHVKNGGIIHGNTASSVGDDVVSAPSSGENYSLTLADRVAGGGRVLWYTDGSVYMGSGGGLYPSAGNEPRYNENSRANAIHGLTKGTALKAIIGGTALELAASQTSLVISGNTAKYGGGVGANGGVVIGEDSSDSMDIPVEKRWEHGENPEESRPTSIDVSLYNEGGVLLETMTLNAENNWSGVFAGLPIGIYTIEEEAVPGYTTEMTGSSANGFVITNTFIPLPKGSLTVTKIVEGSAGDKNALFHFTVTLGDKTISGEYGGMTFTDGVATFALKHGERKTASGLPAGVTYEVTEQEANQNGYTTSVIEVSGTITEEGSMATFINAKDAEETEPPTGSETESESESETETETESEPESETETESGSETETETETENESGSEMETEKQSGSGNGNPTDQGTPNKSVKTGDESRPILWLTLLGISGIALLSLLAARKVGRAGKRRKQ